MTTEETWEEILRTNSADLLWLIDTESGLEGEFKRLDFLTPLQQKKIWDIKGDPIKRNNTLLGFITNGDFKQFQAFSVALKESGQNAIVTRHLSEIKTNWIRSANSDDPRSSIPLKESCLDCLRQNWNELLLKIDYCKIIGSQLGSRNSLTPIQLTQLQGFTEDMDRTSYLLKLLEKGSQKLFDDFLEILNCIQKQELVKQLTPSEAQLALDNVKTTIHDVKLELSSDGDRERKLSEIQSEKAYAVSNGVVKGRVLIFSNRYFTTHDARHGTEYDEANLKNFFKGKLKFQTNVYSSLTSEQMRQTLTDELSKDLKDFDVLILFFMSHGINGEIYGVDGRTLLTKDIVDLLDGERCQQFAGKPKLVFIQACRSVGGRTDGIAPVLEMENLNLDDTDPEVEANLSSTDGENASRTASVPHHRKANIAVFYATVEGDFAYREREGTFFIRYLLQVFTEKAHKEDVQSMVTEALDLVHKLHFETGRQLGQQISSLLRKVYFVI